MQISFKFHVQNNADQIKLHEMKYQLHKAYS